MARKLVCPATFIAALAIGLGLCTQATAGPKAANARVSVVVYLLTLDQECQDAINGADWQKDADGVMRLNDDQVKELVRRVQQNRAGSIMMAPKIATTSGQKATVSVLDDYHYVKAVHVESGAGKVNTRTETASIPLGVRLEVQPTVIAEGKQVTLNLSAYLANLVTGNVPMVPVTTQDADGKPMQTFVQLPNVSKIEFSKTLKIGRGESALMRLGTKSIESRNEYGPPVLSKIPYLQRLFLNTVNSRNASALYLIVTPTVMAD